MLLHLQLLEGLVGMLPHGIGVRCGRWCRRAAERHEEAAQDQSHAVSSLDHTLTLSPISLRLFWHPVNPNGPADHLGINRQRDTLACWVAIRGTTAATPAELIATHRLSEVVMRHSSVRCLPFPGAFLALPTRADIGSIGRFVIRGAAQGRAGPSIQLSVGR